MGSEQFGICSRGNTADEAFRIAHDQACYDYGHAGYTGTIAEKHEYVLLGTATDLPSAYAQAEALMNADDERITDKWGPAGCIRVAGTDEFVFFGWASS
jgi:hypothetical protein